MGSGSGIVDLGDATGASDGGGTAMEPGKLPMRHRLGRWSIALFVLAAAPAGLIAAQQVIVQDVSPAQGAAQVVAQGLSELPEGELVWRIVERQALPRGEAQPGERVTSYVIARDESILLTDVNNGELTDVAYLAPGEAYLVPEGTSQIRSSLTDQPVTYLSFELVPAASADQTGSGILLFTTSAFTAPEGLRDVDLVANVLGMGDESTIPYTGGPVSVFATDGTIDIISVDTGETTTLQPGEMAVFDGEITIRGAGGASVPGVRAFAPLLQGEANEAVYFASVIGHEVIPSAEFTPETATPTPSPTQEVVVVVEQPTEIPTAEPTLEPTAEPTIEPTATPTPELSSDDDEDGLIYRTERAIGTDPNNPDTDGDGWTDGEEYQYETDPLDPKSYPVTIG